jgi:hypothetical protein
MPKTIPSKPVANGTAARTDNCTGSGRPWESGGLCPECRATADTLQSAGFVARRADGSLSPRVPRHSQILNPLPTPAKPQPNGNRGNVSPRMAASSTRERSAPEPEAPSKASERSVGGLRRTARTPAPTPEPTAAKAATPSLVKDRTKTGPTVKQAVAKDPLTKPFTATIEAYLDWLQARMGVKFNAPQRELAGRAITLYGTFQVSPERKAARAAH